MRVLFIPCTIDGLPKHTGSRLWRCDWIADNWIGADVYNGTQRFVDYRLFVFQKAYLGQRVQKLVSDFAMMRDVNKWPIKLAFDLCDADFEHPEHRMKMLQVLPMMDFATASTQPLVEWLSSYLPAHLVPDGVNLDAVGEPREFQATESPKLVWMGYRGNMGCLNEIAGAMNDLGVQGEIAAMSRPVPFEKFVRKLKEYDIMLNPRPDVSPYKYKSDNKTFLAWASGVAVARDGEELEMLLDNENRHNQIVAGKRLVSPGGAGNINHTVQRWIEVCVSEGVRL